MCCIKEGAEEKMGEEEQATGGQSQTEGGGSMDPPASGDCSDGGDAEADTAGKNEPVKIHMRNPAEQIQPSSTMFY